MHDSVDVSSANNECDKRKDEINNNYRLSCDDAIRKYASMILVFPFAVSIL